MKVVENEMLWLSKILSKSKFVFCFRTQSQKVPGTTIKTPKYVQKIFSLAFAMTWPFLIRWFKEIFEFFQKKIWVISEYLEAYLFIGHTVTYKTSCLREAVTHTVAPY